MQIFADLLKLIFVSHLNNGFTFVKNMFQVEIKKAEPRDAAGKMNDNANTWGAPQGGPQMGMGGVSFI